MSETIEKKNNEVVKWLKVGGILCAIAGGAALLLTSLNLVTAPIIEQNNANKQLGGYKAIFSSMQSKSDPVQIEDDDNLANYVIAYSDTNQTNEVGYVYTSKSIAVKSYGNITAMVGISGDTGSPVLGKVYLTEDTLSYKTVFESGYVEPYNSNPTDSTLNDVKCGATFAAQALQSIINSARDHYSSAGDPFKEDLASDVAAIWGSDSTYSVSFSSESTVSEATYLKKSYSFYEDDTMTGEVGRLYAAKYKGDAGDIYVTVSIKGSKDAPEYDKLVVTKDTVTDTASVDAYVAAYNANPSVETLNATTTGDTEKIKAMVDEAKSFYATSGGLDTNENKFSSMITAYKSHGNPSVLETSVAEIDNEATVLRYWSIYGDDASSEIAKVYKINAKMFVEAHSQSGVWADIESNTTFLLSISGDKESPVLGKMAFLANVAGPGQQNTIDDYIKNFDGTGSADDAINTQATYTLKKIWEGINKAKALYSETEAA